MESRLRLIYTLITSVLLLLFAVSPWYIVNREPFYKNVEDVTTLNDLDAQQTYKNYNGSRTYHEKTTTMKLYSKSLIPFYFNKSNETVISKETYSLPKK